MNVFLWIVQVVLAIMFAMSGLAKVLQPKAKLAGKYEWMHDVSQGTVWFIGLVEVLGALGLILPGATGIVPVLTPIAALGFAVLLILAGVLHVRRKELSALGITGFLLVLSVLVAWGRFGPYHW
jgi:uncharacterized membrane protein YphA (DoxX/SURF4 family)